MKIIKIGATWCPTCLIMKPRWAKIEKENPWLKTEYYDFDESKDIIKKYNLEEGKIPVFIFLDKNGKEIERITGEYSEKELTEKINTHKDK